MLTTILVMINPLMTCTQFLVQAHSCMEIRLPFRLIPRWTRLRSASRTGVWYGSRLINSLNTEHIVSNNKGQLLQDPFLNQLRREHVPVSIYLVNGIKLQGQIESFDQYVVLLRNTVTQMVYKHAISTIVPGRPVQFTAVGSDEPAAP